MDSLKSNDESSNVLQVRKSKKSGTNNGQRFAEIKVKVETAIKDHKIFSMSGHYSSVRKALFHRGWVEKIDSEMKSSRRRFSRSENTDDSTIQSEDGNRNIDPVPVFDEAEIINRMLKNVTEDLCWLSKPYPYCWKDINKCDMVNRIPKACFANKVGLCNALNQIRWFNELGVCSTQFPRTYNMSLPEEMEAFKDDFLLTACIGILKWLTSSDENCVRSPDGDIDVGIIEFALRRCAEYVKFKEHEDIDQMETPHTWQHQWDHFLTQYYKLISGGKMFRDSPSEPRTSVIVSNAQTMLNLLKPHWPQFDVEGMLNLWIIKPGGRCCGNGIVIRNRLEHILEIVNPSITKETRYVVQKYMEKPLLIYNTKFDIRQWFLVTNVYPLTVWMYRESYLRFCSSNFNLKNLHESIHLCNNAVQRRYKNGARDSNLPDENMWDCYTFQTYLRGLGYPKLWDEIIYPGMKESFIGALLTSQDNMERRRNSFELYGADFMISEVLTDGPWLIEINSNPAMDSSTSVTARMCPQVLEDIVKVVIDRRDDKNASTGAFEMVFKQNCPPIPPYLGMSLAVRGRKIHKADKHSRKAKYTPSSDTSDEESEGNAVEKRCLTDFMQPIKNIRSAIDGRKSPECHSDSFLSDQSFITLEGKEMELRKKKKKVRKKRVNLDKSGKIDYVRKNIYTVSKKNISRMETRDNSNEQTHLMLENIYKEEMQKIIETLEDSPKKHLKISARSWSVSPSRESEKASPLSIISIGETDRTLGKSLESNNFDSKFVKILQQVEKTKSLPILKDIKDCNRRTQNNSKSSMDYFRDWKYKIDETRKNCEDMLAKLKVFKENNSKIRFNDVLQRRINEEERLICKLNEFRMQKTWTSGRKAVEDFQPIPSLVISSETGAVVNVRKDLITRFKS